MAWAVVYHLSPEDAADLRNVENIIKIQIQIYVS